MPSWTLPLPAQGLNHGYVVGQGRIYKSQELRAWEQEAALIVGQWEPPKHKRLSVTIALYVPSKSLRRFDADGFVKCIVDAVVGKRRDAWVDDIRVHKYTALQEPRIQVTVEEIDA